MGSPFREWQNGNADHLVKNHVSLNREETDVEAVRRGEAAHTHFFRNLSHLDGGGAGHSRSQGLKVIASSSAKSKEGVGTLALFTLKTDCVIKIPL